MRDDLAPGQLLARGVCRHLTTLGLTSVTEFVPTRGLRVDVIALDKKGEIWIIECKSSRADYMSDSKWQGYLDWCDRFFWAVDEDFPTDLLPTETGLIIADPYDASLIRPAPVSRLAAPRRKAVTLKLARTAAERLLRATDPRTGPVQLSS
ncbi:MmcB family DNA repair protein [Halovulum sp. GXIMD14793]